MKQCEKCKRDVAKTYPISVKNSEGINQKEYCRACFTASFNKKLPTIEK